MTNDSVSGLHRAAAQRELATILDEIEGEHTDRKRTEWIDGHTRVDRIERALLLLRDELFNNPNRPSK